MKKKALERIPLREAPEGSDATARLETLEGTEYLVVDIAQEGLRIVLGEKEYANYDAETGIWTEAGIKSLHIPVNALTMGQKEEKQVITWIRGKWNTWRIPQTWADAVEEAEVRIRIARRSRAEDLRRERLKARCEAMPPVPEGFAEWSNGLFGPSMLFYHRTNKRHAAVFCSYCGRTAEYAFRKLDGPRGALERSWEEPVRGQQGTCMLCGAKGIYRSDKTEGVYGKTRHAYVIQKYQGGLVVRQFHVERHSAAGRKDSYIQWEEGRAFYLPELKHLDYQYTDNWTGQTSWYDHNIPGLKTIDWPNGAVWPGSFEALAGSAFQYSAMREYSLWHKEINVKRYFDRYLECPAMEMLVKMNIRKLAEDVIIHGCRNICPRGRSAAEVLQLPAAEAKRFIREDGSARQLKLMQMKAERGLEFDWKTEKELLRSEIELHRIGIALQYMTARKLLNYLLKVTHSPDLRSLVYVERVKAASVTYTDYLAMRAGMGYDMRDSVILFPRDLQAAHNEMAVLQDRAKTEEEILKKELLYGKGIRNRYPAAMKKYAWENEGMLIRPAADAGEIIREGRTLHHCVGGDTYLSRHAAGESTILFLRKKEHPEIPYITVEISGRRICQWYGAYDRKTDEKENEVWLNNYLRALRKRAV